MKCKKPLTPYQLIEDKSLKQEAITFKNSRGKSNRAKETTPKKVQYGSSAGQYGSVFGNGKVEMNKTGYIVQQSSMIRTEGKFSILILVNFGKSTYFGELKFFDKFSISVNRLFSANRRLSVKHRLIFFNR